MRFPGVRLQEGKPALRGTPNCAYTGFSCCVAPIARFDFGTGLEPESGRVALA